MVNGIKNILLWTAKFGFAGKDLILILCLTSLGAIGFLIDAYSRKILLDGAAQGSLLLMIKTVVIAGGLYLLMSGINALNYRQTEGLNRRLEHKIREYMYGKLFTMRFREKHKLNNEDIIQRFSNDIEQISQSVSWFLVTCIGMVVSGAIALSVLVSIDIVLLLATLCIGTIALLVSKRVARKIGVAKLELIHAHIQVESHLMDLIKGRRTWLGFKREAWGTHVFAQRRSSLVDKQINHDRLAFLSYQMPVFLRRFLGVILGLYAVYMIYTGKGTIGLIFALQVIGNQALAPFNTVGDMYLKYEQLKISFNRITEFAEFSPPPQPVVPIGAKGEFEFVLTQVVLRYHPTDLWGPNDLKVKQGEKLLVIGPSGSGKSTFCRLLCGLYLPDAGEVEIRAVPTGNAASESIAEVVGYIPQVSISPLSKVSDLIQEAHPLLENIPKESLFEQLSDGQKQLVVFIRCLQNKPEILILDEWLASADPTVRIEIYNILKIYEGTVVMVSHNETEFDWVDRTIVMSKGRIECP